MKADSPRCALRASVFALLAALVAATATSAFAAPRTVTMDEDYSRVWSKVANERAKANAQRSRIVSDDDDRCGVIDIGNVESTSSRRAPREVITVVTGDVINAPARCK